MCWCGSVTMEEQQRVKKTDTVCSPPDFKYFNKGASILWALSRHLTSPLSLMLCGWMDLPLQSRPVLGRAPTGCSRSGETNSDHQHSADISAMFDPPRKVQVKDTHTSITSITCKMRKRSRYGFTSLCRFCVFVEVLSEFVESLSICVSFFCECVNFFVYLCKFFVYLWRF